ncbi:hypothetical protein [Sulfurimonas sp.]|uniref:hypothetical protein n=1 Tax=Sulfurimonas sp. TaxID=2022749 RepID=UPI002B4A05DA|nr:hypothetical protein [Sulfurimonas sp.]
MKLKEYDEKRIEFIFKRIDILHKSILRKLTIFTILILNIYFTKLWDLYKSMFDKIIQWVQDLLSNHIPLFDMLKIPEIISYTLYATEIGFALFIVLIWIYFATFELSDIKKLEQELKKYDLYYNIKIANIENDTLFKKLDKIVSKLLKS